VIRDAVMHEVLQLLRSRASFRTSHLILEHSLRLPIRDETTRREDDGVDAQRHLGLGDCLIGEGGSPSGDTTGEKKNEDVE